MKPTNRTYAPIEAFVDELARCGVEHAVACPGSRNAPLLLTLGGEPRIQTRSVLDERSAAFVALGMAKASGRPVALTCTSGTAAANFLPAVVEAHEARVPLIVLTADRPPELREVGAGQSIDQVKLYGAAVKWFVEVGNLEPGRESAVHHRALACRAWATAGGGRPGPVHLNFPLREPLAPVPEEMDPEPWQGRPDGRPWVSVLETGVGHPEEIGDLASEIREAPRGAIVCGPSTDDVATGAAWLARVAGWPLLAEPTSGVRCGRHDRTQVIAHYDALLRAPRWAGAHRPDLVLRVGDTPTSKPLRAWLAEARQVVIDPHAAWHEPTRTAERVLVASPDRLLREVAGVLHGEARPDPAWLQSWRAADALVPSALAEVPDPFEPKAYVALADALPPDAVVWISSSMPIRDVESFFPSVGTPIRFLSNRGANGIDGVVSSALGAAAASGRGHAYLLTGELTLIHDVGALLAARRLGLELTIVCVNNGGGGIFDFLPVARHADAAAYEELVATPSGIDLARLATGIGLRHALAETTDELRAAAAEPGLVEVRTDRALNVEQHRDLFARVARELDRRVT
ncbi:MAG: 2-succinyl-5-enolpyruvyl-6-hydroxy-3-cyclohexene-1-carboxylic-acid synthase [Thermoleophilaceae bacterium]|nr:2-succinyl-5-enolpyruvyl-6-hydroxy-3-cyclohexene-1-carboxylic-acid synthase [Thermoleophilaceae bacterium]